MDAGSWATTSSQMNVHDFCSLAWHDFSIREAVFDDDLWKSFTGWLFAGCS